jgi:hypothetical protein
MSIPDVTGVVAIKTEGLTIGFVVANPLAKSGTPPGDAGTDVTPVVGSVNLPLTMIAFAYPLEFAPSIMTAAAPLPTIVPIFETKRPVVFCIAPTISLICAKRVPPVG